MASTLRRRLVDRLFRPKHDYLPGTTIFREIDVDLVAETLALDQKGASDGLANIPAETASSLSVAEKAIHRQIGEYWSEAREGARRAYESLYGRSVSLSADTEIDKLIGLPIAIGPRLSEIARSEKDALRTAYSEVQNRERALDAFQQKEGLTESPRPIQPTAMRFLWLASACLLELAVNASIFANADEFGIAGGLLKVIAIPVFNVGVTFALVFLGARHVLRKGRAKAFGIVATGLAAFWMVAFNLGIAHWRDSLSASLSIEAGKVAFARVFSDTFQLASDESWMLFGVGVVAAMIAALEGWLWEDPHPGYSARAQAFAKAVDDFADVREQAVERIEELASSALQSLENEQRKAETAMSRRPELAAQANALSEDLAAYKEHLIGVAEDLAARYREANLRTRSTAGPQYFEEAFPIKLPMPTFRPFSRSTSGRDVAGLLASAMSQIAAAEHEAKRSLPTLSDIRNAND